MVSNEKATNSPKQKIIIDTNIFSYLSRADVGKEIILYFLELVRRGFEFAYSNITVYELTRGASEKKEEELMEILNPYFKYYLDDRVVLAAARLDNIMKPERINVESVDHGDKFIAATAILTGSLILTANARDFPWPLFHEVENKPIIFETKNKRTICYMLALIQPDYGVINKNFTQRPK